MILFWKFKKNLELSKKVENGGFLGYFFFPFLFSFLFFYVPLILCKTKFEDSYLTLFGSW